MSFWKQVEKWRRETEERLQDLEKAENQHSEEERIAGDPVYFAKHYLKFTPYQYQINVLCDWSKRITVRMSRQAGKTTTIAVRAIWYAATHPRTLSLIVAPSLRQSSLD